MNRHGKRDGATPLGLQLLQPDLENPTRMLMPKTQTRCSTAQGGGIVPERHAIDSLDLFAVHLCGIITVIEYLLVKTCHTCTIRILAQAHQHCLLAQALTNNLVQRSTSVRRRAVSAHVTWMCCSNISTAWHAKEREEGSNVPVAPTSALDVYQGIWYRQKGVSPAV